MSSANQSVNDAVLTQLIRDFQNEFGVSVDNQTLEAQLGGFKNDRQIFINLAPSRADFGKAYNDGKIQLVSRKLSSDLETPVSVYLKLCQNESHSFLMGRTRWRNQRSLFNDWFRTGNVCESYQRHSLSQSGCIDRSVSL